MRKEILIFTSATTLIGILLFVGVDTPTAKVPAQIASPEASPIGSPAASPVGSPIAVTTDVTPFDPGLATVEALSTQLASISGTATSQAITEATIAVLSTQVASVEQTATADALPSPTETLLPAEAPSPTATATQTPTLPPAGAVLYEANISGGFEEWEIATGWQIFAGMLVNSGSCGTLVVPSQSGNLDNVAVEVEIQTVRERHQDRFAFAMHDGLVRAAIRGGSAVLWIADTQYNSEKNLTTGEIIIGNDWHTYRLEISGNRVRFLIDGFVLFDITDNRVLVDTSGQIGLSCESDSQINVRSLKVIAL